MSCERFERRETRHLARDVRTLLRRLERHAQPVVYQVNTLYLDHPQPTWSSSPPKPGAWKLRLRQYGADAPWFFERKRRVDGRVLKVREPVTTLPLNLRLIASVHYQRTAFDCPDGLRVTIDRRVLSARGLLPGKVVEVKGEPPPWLARCLPPTTEGFSKSAWALGRWNTK